MGLGRSVLRNSLNRSMTYIEYVLNRIFVMKRESEKIRISSRIQDSRNTIAPFFDRPKLRIVKTEMDDELEEGRQKYFDYWKP